MELSPLYHYLSVFVTSKPFNSQTLKPLPCYTYNIEGKKAILTTFHFHFLHEAVFSNKRPVPSPAKRIIQLLYQLPITIITGILNFLLTCRYDFCITVGGCRLPTFSMLLLLERSEVCAHFIQVFLDSSKTNQSDGTAQIFLGIF